MAKVVLTFSRLAALVAVVLAIALLVGVSFLPGVFAARAGVETVERDLLDAPPLPEDLGTPPRTSFVTARDGTLLDRLHGPVDRIPVPFERIPPIMRQAVIATEDADFYEHNGVDHQAIVRAAVTNLEAGRIEEGASTITQQYVRNALLSPEQTLERKLTEAQWAVALEQRLSKDEILERYLNSAYFGNGVYGVATAARFYFSKRVEDLVSHEAALLAGLIRAPEVNDPIDNPAQAKRRRDIVLRQMAAEGYLTQEELRTALERPLWLKIQPDPGPVEPFLIEWVKRVAYAESNDLQPGVQAALGDTPAERQRMVFEGGITITTTLDPVLDRIADRTVAAYLTDPLHDPLGGLISLDPYRGAVRAMALGPKAFGNCPEGQWPCEVTKVNPLVPDGGAPYGRQPGSSFKPIVAATALAAGIPPTWTASTESGEPIPGCGTEEEPYAPENYSMRDRGIMHMYDAVENSVNVYFAKLAREVGVLRVRDMARALGLVHSPNLDDFGPNSCSIGLGTANVYPLEMASVYATFANNGIHCEPYVIERITGPSGEVLYQHEPKCRPVLEPQVAHRVIDILRGPPSPGGTAPYVGATLDRPVAGKTGTTSEWIDAWFMGLVPQLVTAAWVGYELPTCPPGVTTGCGSMFGVEAGGVTYRRVTGGTIPGHMWADYMAKALAPYPAEWFPAPPPVDLQAAYERARGGDDDGSGGGSGDGGDEDGGDEGGGDGDGGGDGGPPAHSNAGGRDDD